MNDSTVKSNGETAKFRQIRPKEPPEVVKSAEYHKDTYGDVFMTPRPFDPRRFYQKISSIREVRGPPDPHQGKKKKQRCFCAEKS